MKKFFVLVFTVIALGMIVASCTSGQRCAAYGERSRYQMERH